MACRHPIIVDGRCADCGAAVNGENGAKNAVQKQNGQTPAKTGTPPENGQETAKKPTRKRKT
jgi:hypothetical protein